MSIDNADLPRVPPPRPLSARHPGNAPPGQLPEAGRFLFLSHITEVPA